MNCGGVFALAFPLLPAVLTHEPWQGIGFALCYAVLVGFVGTLLYFEGLRHIQLSHAMPLTYAELVVAVIIGVFAFGDSLPWQSVLGGALIVTSSLCTVLVRPPSSPGASGSQVGERPVATGLDGTSAS